MSDNADLTTLRIAAQQREWNTAQDTLKRLLTHFEPLPALEFAATRIIDHLPRFEAYYPEAGWVRQLVMTVVSYASAPDELPAHAITQFPSPGCGNFVSAVLDLARAVQAKYTVFERYSFMTNAVANVILADLMNFYYSAHPDEWTHLTEHANDVDTATGLTIRQLSYIEFWGNAEVAERDIAAWLTLADTIEHKMAV